MTEADYIAEVHRAERRRVDAVVQVAGLIVALAILGLSSLSSGCGASARQRELRVSLAAVDASAAAFEEWDRHHQHDIVVAAQSREDGQAKLADYRASREKVVAAFEAAYRAIAAAALDPDGGTIQPALDAAESIRALVSKLKGGP